MFSDETRAAAKDPWPTLSFIGAILDSPTDVLTEILVFSFNLYNILYDFASIFAFLLRVSIQSSSDSLSKNLDMSKRDTIPSDLFSSICFIHVFKVTRCSTDCDLGIPPICIFGVASTIRGFIFSVIRASSNFALQHFICIKRILFRDSALPFFFQICVRDVRS